MKAKIIFVFIISLLFISCKQEKKSEITSNYQDKPAFGDMLVEMSIADAIILNPVIASDASSHAILGNIFASLIKYGKDLEIECELAEKYSVDLEKKEIYFKLKKGIKWHDGMPVTMKDVKFTFDKYMDETVKTPYRSNFDNIKYVKVLNDIEIKAGYSKLLVNSLQGWMMGIMPEHIYGKGDFNTHPNNRKPVGCGPYCFYEWNPAVFIKLKAFDNYYDGKPYIESIMTRVIPDTSVQFMELKAGNADLMYLTPELYLKKTYGSYFDNNFNKYKINSFSYTYMAFNLADPLFADKRVRKALTYAINRKEIINGVMQNMAQEITGPFLPGSWAYNENVKALDYDIKKAENLLAEAGWKRDKSGILKKDGKKFEFELITNNGNKQREETAVIIQQQLSKLGIKVNVRTYAWNILINEKVNKKNFSSLILGWSLTPDPDCYDLWHSGKTKEGEFNFIGYNNSEADSLMLRGRETFDREKRIPIYKRLHEIIADDAPYVFLFAPYSLPIIHKRFHGIKPALAGISYNQPKWYVPLELQKYRILMEK